MSTSTDHVPDQDLPVAPGWRRGVVLIALSLTFGLVQFDASVVNVALTAVRDDLGGGVSNSQWLIDGYAVPFAACLLSAGAVGDRLGHRTTCLGGFALFAAASAAAALATGWPVLIAARVLQGLGAAAMLPTSLALVGRLYPAGPERSRALGTWGGVASAGLVAGPAIGGLLIEAGGWPAIFWVNLPIAAVVATVVAVGAPAGGARRPGALDPVGTVLVVAALGAGVGGVIEAGQGALVLAVGLLLVAAVLAVVAVRRERRSAAPLVSRALAGSARFGWALVVGFSFNAVLYGALLTVSLTLQSDHGLSPVRAGLALLPLALVVSVGATLSGRLDAVLGPRRPMLAGFSAAAAGAVVIGAAALTGSAAVLVVGLSVVGLISLAMPAMTGVALSAAPSEHAGVASGALNTARQGGGAVSVAVLGALLAAGGYATGLALAAAVSVLVCGVAAAGTVRTTRPEGSAV